MVVKKNIRNIGILAHVDAGKTTITENILFKSGRIRALGRVDEGTTQTDWLEVERSRGISVKAASTVFTWRDTEINLIDTPGHVDFAGEVERALMVMDGAILVVSAAEGVEAQTETLWHALESMGIPTVIFINKIDRLAADSDQVLKDIRKLMSTDVIPVEVFSGESTKEPVVSSIFGDQSKEDDEFMIAREQLYEFLAERDEKLLAKYINEERVSFQLLKDKLSSLSRQGEVFPILYGSALLEVGITELLDVIIDFLPAPEVYTDGSLSGLVFKIEHDDTMGRLAHVRLYCGEIENRDLIYNLTQDKEEKVTQIRKIYSNKYEDVGRLEAGDIAAVCGLSQTQIGDVLGSQEYVPGGFNLAVPLLKVKVFPESDSEYLELVEALQILTDEDPLLSLEWLRQQREIQLKIMGFIQLEILASLLKDRFGLTVNFGKPSVIYKETPAAKGEGFVRYTMPKPCWAVLRFKIEPGPRGSGLIYTSEVRSDTILLKYQKQVEETVPRALEQGLYGWEVTDLKVTLIDGEYHVEHTHPPDFMVATPMGIMDGLANTGSNLLEPVLAFTITVPEEFGGRVLSDITQMRGDLETPEINQGKLTVQGKLPVATSLDYPVKLSSLSGGRGIIKTKFAGYQICPLELGEEASRRGVNPLERSKYILSVRNALDH